MRSETLRTACQKGTEWLLQLANDDGSIGPAEQRLYYYRVPWALALVGQIDAASAKLGWIDRHMFSPGGAFEGVSPRGVFDQRYGSYPIACLIVGAALLNRFDVVQRGKQHLLTWQDPETGGFCNSNIEIIAATEQELFPTCQGGMALVIAGELDAARRAGDWLKRLWDLQPDVDRKLYSIYSRQQELVTDFSPDQQAIYVTKKDEPWQFHYNGGIAAAFLTQLHWATSEKEWLDLARKYQGFSMTTDDCQFQSMQVCKSGWGAGLLYAATGEQAYREWTLRMAQWFVDQQFDDGRWENTKFWNPDPTLADNIEVTVEFVMHLANIRSYLAARC